MRSLKTLPLLAFVVVPIWAAPAWAAPPAVRVEDARVRATPPGATATAAYLTLTSAGSDRLTGVTSPAAPRVFIHGMVADARGVSRMTVLEHGLDLPAGQAVALRPGGLHVMLERLPAPLRAGDSVSLHLTFAHAPPQDVTAPVRAVAAR